MVRIIETKRTCIDIHKRVIYIRIDPANIHDTLAPIFEMLSNLSWISKFDEDYTRTSFQRRAENTLADVQTKLGASATDDVVGDAGEYVVSELAREAIVEN